MPNPLVFSFQNSWCIPWTGLLKCCSVERMRPPLDIHIFRHLRNLRAGTRSSCAVCPVSRIRSRLLKPRMPSSKPCTACSWSRSRSICSYRHRRGDWLAPGLGGLRLLLLLRWESWELLFLYRFAFVFWWNRRYWSLTQISCRPLISPLYSLSVVTAVMVECSMNSEDSVTGLPLTGTSY